MTCSASSTVLINPVASLGQPIIIDRHWALLIATFNRFGSNKKSIPLGALSPELEVKEWIAIGASWPWKRSTVPTFALPSSLCSNLFTWTLYGAVTRMSLGVISPVRFSLNWEYV